MANYISGDDLLKRWDIRGLELAELVYKGVLIPLDEFGETVYHPEFKTWIDKQNEIRERLFDLSGKRRDYKERILRHQEELQGKGINKSFDEAKEDLFLLVRQELYDFEAKYDLFGFGWNQFDFPYYPDEAREIVNLLCNSIYPMENVHQLELDDDIIKVYGIRRHMVRPNGSHRVNDSIQKPDKTKSQIESKPQQKKKLRPSQRHRLACRKVAAGIWEIHPEITIAGMIQRDEINVLFEGRVYAERTIRNWIKDLCPNRAPGRRKSPS